MSSTEPDYHREPTGRIVLPDAGDARLDDFRDLIVADADRGSREVVIAEGINVVRRLIHSQLHIRAVAGVAAKLDGLADSLRDLRAPVYELDKWVLSDVVGFRLTRGVLAAVTRPAPRSAQDLLACGNHFVVLETINDFENLGAVFRNAAAFGLDGVLLDARCADPFYRRSVRVSMGHVFGVPFAVLPEPWTESLARMRAEGIEMLGLTPRAGATPLRDVPALKRWAVLLGAEGPGLSDRALATCDRLVRIPMAEGVDSLNVATAGAIAFAALTA